jgi:hypothetical protein
VEGERSPIASLVGTTLLAANVRRSFRLVLRQAALDDTAWTPRELSHGFVSLMPDDGVRIEYIVEVCGQAGTRVTEAVYRQQLRPVIFNGAEAIERIFALAEAARRGRRK